MTRMNAIFAFAPLLAALVSAAPMPAVVTQMITETSWTTVDVMATIYVDENGVPYQTQTGKVPAGVFAQATSSTTSTKTSTFVAVQSTPSSSVASSTTSAAEFSIVTPITTPSVVFTIPTTSSSIIPSPITPSAVATTLVTTSKPPTTTAINVQNRQASSSNTCEGQGAACLGDITHWDGGLGACGWDVNTNGDTQIALPVGLMGSQSNGNPYCGRSLTILNPATGTTVQATVGDKCMGCEGRSIDLTNVLFSSVTNGQGDGRVSGIEWWFN